VLQELRIDAPELEPDPVLLAQLSQLSAASVPHRREGPARVLVATVTVVVLAFFSWLTGAVPGVASPFDGVRDSRPAPHAPKASPTPDGASEGDQGDERGESTASAPVVPPGQVRTHHDNGNHTGLTKPNHHDNGNHTGLDDAQQDNGNHNGQTKPHQNHGHHNGQTKPHQNHGHHNGQTKPHQNNGHHHGQAGTRPSLGNGGGNGNGHHG
jgi:hypothetical protein